MRNIIVGLVVAGVTIWVLMMGYSVRVLWRDFGATIAVLAATGSVLGCIGVGRLVDLEKANMRRILERIELRHGIDLTAEKREVADI